MAVAEDRPTENLRSVNEALEGHSISDLTPNTASELANLQENFLCVNAALKGLSISDLMRNMASTIPSSTENFQCVNEAPETLTLMDGGDLVQSSERKSTKAPELTQFPQEFRNAGTSPGLLPTSANLDLQKAKEQLVQSVGDLAVEMHQQRELVKLIMNEVWDVAEVVEDNNKLNLAEREDEIAELKKETALLFRSVDYLMQSAEGKSIEAPELTQFIQEFRNDDTSPGLLPTPANLDLQEDKITEFKKKQKAKQHFSQRVQNRWGKMNVREKKQEYIVAGKSHGDSFADQ